MNTILVWWLHMAVGSGLLLLVWLATLCWRQPARQQWLGTLGMAAALLVAGLSLAPDWMDIQVSWLAPDNPEPVALSAESSAQATDVTSVDVPRFDSYSLWIPPTEGELEPVDKHMAFNSLELPAELPSYSLLDENLEAAHPTTVPAKSSTWSSGLVWLQVSYLGIACLLLLRWLVGYLALNRLLARCKSAPAGMTRLFEDMAAGMRPKPRLLVSHRLAVPVSCGIRRPTVIMPADWCNRKTPEQIRWVLAHELTHLRRGDACTSLLFSLAQAIYFFLPWFWWLRRKVRLCQEYVADSAAAAVASRSEDYADFLLRLSPAPALPAAATGVLGSSSDLFRRITMLLKSPMRIEQRCPRKWSWTTAVVVTAVAVVASGIGISTVPASASAPVPDNVKPEKKKSPKDTPPKKDAAKEKSPKKNNPLPANASKALQRALEDLQNLPPGVDKDEIRKHIEMAVKQAEEARRKAREAFENARKDFPKAQEDIRKRMAELHKKHRKEMEEMQKRLKDLRIQAPGRFVPRDVPPFFLPGQLGRGRLGVMVAEPNPVLVAQLDLPENQGLVVERVQPKSAAAKAGIKTHDILLELAGKPVPQSVSDFVKMVGKIKANTKVDAVVLRKGKKETIKGVALPEAKKRPALPFEFGGFEFPGFMFPKNFPQDQNMTIIMRDRNKFMTRRQEDGLQINITGKVEDGKARAEEITIRKDGKVKKYNDVSKVPNDYLEKVKRLIKVGEEGGSRIEIRPTRSLR